jgi:AcrR family transcriptional regulator
MPTKLSPQQKIVNAALALIEKSGWRTLSLSQLAHKSGVPVETFYELCPNKAALMKLIGASVDIAALKRFSPPDERTPARDRAFDAVLTVFEAMTPFKPALKIIHTETRGDPAAWLDAAPVLLRSANWVADSAGLTTSGLYGFGLTRGIALLMADTMSVWLEDGEDHSKTMAHVDRRLRAAQGWFDSFKSKDEKKEEAKAD